jgi:hypothetical protein
LPGWSGQRSHAGWLTGRTGIIIMSLLIVYVIAIMVGDLFAVGIVEIVERYSEKASLGVFLALYFVVFWVAWRVAVRVTEPRPALSQPAAKP